jgi:hypothetical protein
MSTLKRSPQPNMQLKQPSCHWCFRAKRMVPRNRRDQVRLLPEGNRPCEKGHDGFSEIGLTLLERMAGTTRLELATSAVTAIETTRHGWLPKPRFGTLGNNYWTMKGPRNGLCRTTAEALTKDESSNPDHPFPSFGGGFDYYATPRISPAECALRWTTASEAAVASCRVLSPATLLEFAPTFRTRAFHDWSTRKPSRSPCNYLNRFCKHWRFPPFQLRVVCYLD